MALRNTQERYGWLSIVLHWLSAALVLGLFGLGLWMTSLGYYDPWYHRAPELHKALGICLLALLVARLLWLRLISPAPLPVPGQSALLERAAKAGHSLLYLGMLAVMVSGYLISTADGRGISVFGLFEVPALMSGLPDQEDRAGAVHLFLAWTLVALAALHALAALKHHFIDRDATLKRMLGRS